MQSLLKKLGSKRADSKHLKEEDDKRIWSRAMEKHAYGEFSFAVAQANGPIEDHSHVVSGRTATFVGVFDGHGGPDASVYACDRIFNTLRQYAQRNRAIFEHYIKAAVSETEKGFMNLTAEAIVSKPELATVGSCCLVGVIWKKKLFVANLGDSRAVLGYTDIWHRIHAEQLTSDHNANLEEVRDELMVLHPHDSEIVVLKEGVWRVKGIIQVSRAIGDGYMKKSQFNPPSTSRFHVSGADSYPVLSAEPAILSRTIQERDRFLIFASDGLWENLTSQEAVEIVHKKPRKGIARRLLMCAIEKATAKVNTTYNDIKTIEAGAQRRLFHDDITVVVLFIDHKKFDNANPAAGLTSVQGFADPAPASFI